MITDEIIGLLTGMSPARFRIIQRVADLASVKDAPPTTPAAYVFTEAAAGLENRFGAGAFEQQVIRSVAVVVVTRNVSDAVGGAASTDMEALSEAVIEALIGQRTASMLDPLSYAEGELLQASGGYVWFKHLFSTSNIVRKQS